MEATTTSDSTTAYSNTVQLTPSFGDGTLGWCLTPFWKGVIAWGRQVVEMIGDQDPATDPYRPSPRGEGNRGAWEEHASY